MLFWCDTITGIKSGTSALAAFFQCTLCIYTSACVFTMSHIVDAVQVALSFLIIHILAFGSHNLDWVMAEKNLTRWPAAEKKQNSDMCRKRAGAAVGFHVVIKRL